VRGSLCVLDPLGRLALAQLREARDETVEIAAARGFGRNLAERCDGHRRANFRPGRHDRTIVTDCEPAARAVCSVDGADEHARTRLSLGCEDAGDRRTRLRGGERVSGGSLELVVQAHVATIGSVATVDAKELFAPLGPSYDRVGATLSFGQDPRWRRFLVSRLPRDGGHVLDVATGTGLVAAELLRRGFTVTGVDQSPAMLARARERFGPRIELVEGSAESLPFADNSFDHLTVTYLLRYVDDPAATLAELARVVRSGGVVASLEFGVPTGLARPAWELYVRAGLPLAGRVLRHGWSEVGDFLGGSIREYWELYPLERQLELWHAAGISDVSVCRLSLGGGVVMWGTRA
jgi:demethylmenaquinone methyltransferase/2-methoxy-6-polyprenyl-1,4-benzoquinol methylase